MTTGEAHTAKSDFYGAIMRLQNIMHKGRYMGYMSNDDGERSDYVWCHLHKMVIESTSWDAITNAYSYPDFKDEHIYDEIVEQLSEKLVDDNSLVPKLMEQPVEDVLSLMKGFSLAPWDSEIEFADGWKDNLSEELQLAITLAKMKV